MQVSGVDGELLVDGDGVTVRRAGRPDLRLAAADVVGVRLHPSTAVSNGWLRVDSADSPEPPAGVLTRDPQRVAFAPRDAGAFADMHALISGLHQAPSRSETPSVPVPARASAPQAAVAQSPPAPQDWAPQTVPRVPGAEGGLGEPQDAPPSQSPVRRPPPESSLQRAALPRPFTLLTVAAVLLLPVAGLVLALLHPGWSRARKLVVVAVALLVWFPFGAAFEELALELGGGSGPEVVAPDTGLADLTTAASRARAVLGAATAASDISSVTALRAQEAGEACQELAAEVSKVHAEAAPPAGAAQHRVFVEVLSALDAAASLCLFALDTMEERIMAAADGFAYDRAVAEAVAQLDAAGEQIGAAQRSMGLLRAPER